MGFLKGKTAIITGGGRSVLKDGSCGSIGYGIATAYAKEGANLVITGRNKQKLADAKEELERLYNIEVLPVQADVSAGADNETVVRNVIDETIAKFGRINVLINNAQASASGVAANEWGPDGINTNIICPLAWTAQLENFQQTYPEAFEANVKMPPAGHYGDVEKEIGRVCVQLTSPDFKYMNGETLTLEGGMGLRP